MKIADHPAQRVTSLGFTIVEVVIAIGIVAVGLVAIIGLVPVGIDMTNDTSGRFGGTAWVEAAFEDIRSIPTGSPEGAASPQFKIPLPAAGETTVWTGYFSEGGIESDPENAKWAVEITLLRSDADRRGLLHAHGRARWPAFSPSGFERGRVHLTTAFAK